MAFIEPDGIDLLKRYYVYERDIMPSVGNVYYTNTEYYSSLGFKGYNKFAARRPSSTGGWVLPNCTGYSYGRVLETCGLTKCDYIAGDASQWFNYNKNLFDSGNGGFPYIQLKSNDKGYNLGSGYVADNSAMNLLKLIMLLCRPGNVVCYGEGTSSLNGGMVFGEEGHVQTIEKIISDDESYNKMIRDIKIGQFVVGGVAAIFGATLLINTAAYGWKLLTETWQALALVHAAGNTDALYNLLNHYQEIGLITSDAEWQRIWEALSEFAYTPQGVQFVINFERAARMSAGELKAMASGLLLVLGSLGAATYSVISGMLNNIDITTFPATVISQSSANGYSSDSSIGLWNRDTIYLYNSIGAIEGDPTLHGIILTPCQEPPQFARRGGFPWQLGNNIGLYD